MPLVHECGHPECSTLTMGPLCLAHERQERAARPPRQRLATLPFLAAALAGVAAAFLARARLHF